MAKAVQSTGYAPYSDKASGKLDRISVRASDNDGFIVSCQYERGMPEDYVFEDEAGMLKYFEKQIKKIGSEDDDSEDEE